jgi:hypothetical protein
MRVCSIDGCLRRHEARGWCSKHYNRWLKHGNPNSGSTSTGEALAYFNDVVLTYDGDDCLIWPYATIKSGYASLSKDNKVQYVHRLVCEHIHGPAPSSEYEVAHSCGKGRLGCVCSRHLSWKTRTGNMADAISHGTTTRGEKNAQAKLTKEEVRQIRALRNSFTQSALAEMFDVSQTTIKNIQLRQRWAWLT